MCSRRVFFVRYSARSDHKRSEQSLSHETYVCNTNSKCLGSGKTKAPTSDKFSSLKRYLSQHRRHRHGKMKRPVLGDDVTQIHECLVQEDVFLSLPSSSYRRRGTWSTNLNDSSDLPPVAKRLNDMFRM